MSSEIYAKLTESIVAGDPDAVLEYAKQALQAGLSPLDIIQSGLMPGMNIVGDKFAQGEFFLPDLIIAADGMQQAMKLLEPELQARHQVVQSPGTVVIGTVKGDIHEIGKSLVATMLSANGFKVHDLGVDVSIEKSIVKVKETGANLLGLSALLTTTMTGQREVVQALEQAGLRQQVKIMVGGAPVTRAWAERIGADGYAEDAASAVQLARRLVGLVGS
jgi:corrinoid protein of di/trimethylamine methyltransferase